MAKKLIRNTPKMPARMLAPSRKPSAPVKSLAPSKKPSAPKSNVLFARPLPTRVGAGSVAPMSKKK